VLGSWYLIFFPPRWCREKWFQVIRASFSVLGVFSSIVSLKGHIIHTDMLKMSGGDGPLELSCLTTTQKEKRWWRAWAFFLCSPFCLTTLQLIIVSAFIPFQVLGFIPRTEEKTLSFSLFSYIQEDEITKLTLSVSMGQTFSQPEIWYPGFKSLGRIFGGRMCIVMCVRSTT
jgi:hypothetical protein